MVFTQDEFQDLLDDAYEQVNVCGVKMDAGRVLRTMDIAAFTEAYWSFINSIEDDENE